MKHQVNPVTGNCVMCGRNAFNRKHTPECDYVRPAVGQPTPQTGESTTQPPCKGCGRPFDRHWQGTEGVFCNSADYPDEHKLFGAIVSDKKYIPAESTGVEGDRSDPWKAVDRIRRKHEAVVNALRRCQAYLHQESCEHDADDPQPRTCLNCEVNIVLAEVDRRA